MGMQDGAVPSAATTADGRVVLDGAQLKQLRQHKGWSQEALAGHCFAQRLCVSIASIKRAEAGRSVLYRTARHLATVYGVDPVRLLALPAATPAGTATGATAGPPQPQAADEEVRSIVVLGVALRGRGGPALLERVALLVRQFGGMLQPDGEGGLSSPGMPVALFGVPQAYRSDAERSAQCALEIARTLGPQDCAGVVVVPRQWPDAGAAGGLALPFLPGIAGAPGLQEAEGGAPVLVEHGIAAQLFERFELAPAQPLLPAYRQLLRAQPAQGTLPLVGRYVELQQFKAVAHTMQETQCGHVLYLRGAAGVGKSRLLAELAQIARQAGFAGHQAVVLDFGVETGTGAWGQIVRSLLALPEGSADAVGAALAQALAERGLPAGDATVLRPLLGLAPEPAQAALYAALPHAVRRQRTAEALHGLILRAAIEQPVVLFVEDVHWGDAVLFETLRALMPLALEAPVAWVLSSRHEHDPLDAQLHLRGGELPLTIFDLAPLRPAEAQALALQFAHVDADYRRQCVARAQGNPLFLTQLLLCGQGQSVPGSLARLLQAQLDRLEPPERRALRAASAIGQRFALALLRELLQAPDYEPLALQQLHLVRPVGPGTWSFVHDLVMQAVHEAIVPAQRAGLHRQLAELYQGRDAALHAQHLHRAQDPRAPAAYLQAMREHIAAWRYEEALALAAQCRGIGYAPVDAHALAMLAGEAASSAGRSAEARAQFEQALAAAATPLQRVEAVRGLARALNVLEDLVAEERLLDEALPLAQAAGAHAALGDLLYLKGNLFFPRGDFAACRSHHEAALHHAHRAGAARTEAAALSGLGDSYYAEGRMARAREVFAQCLALCEREGLAAVEASNRFMLGTVRLYLGETAQGLEDALASAALGARVGNRRAEIVSRLTAGWALIATGALARAREEIESGLQTARALGAARFEPFLTESLARVSWLEGDAALARAQIDAAWADVERLGLHRFIGPWVLGTRALLAADEAEGRAALAQGLALLTQGCVAHNAYRFHLAAAEACLAWGDAAGARGFAQRLRGVTPADEPCAWVEHHGALVEAAAAWTETPGAAPRERLLALAREGGALGFSGAMPVLQRRLATL